MKKKVLIFGAGVTGDQCREKIKDSAEVVGILDNNSEKWGTMRNGIKIIGNAEAAKTVDFDEIVVASLPGLYVIEQELLEAGIDSTKINKTIIETFVKARVNFLDDFSKMYHVLPPPIHLPRSCALRKAEFFKGNLQKKSTEIFQSCRSIFLTPSKALTSAM